jgi:BolA protein
MTRHDRIIALLNKGLSPTNLTLLDNSASHAGHAGARPEGETHYQLIIESPAFAGKTKIQRHQAIYALLADEFKTGLHALMITAKTPGE